MAYQPIENYGMIGDMHTVALVHAAIQPALTEDGLANEPWVDKVAERLLTSFECYAGALRARR